MSGLLLELRRQIAHNRRKAAYEERMRASAQEEKPQEVFSQKTKRDKSRTRKYSPKVQERKVNVVSREDFLLSQIDEFRERAKQLQSLLDSRETEAQELQTLVDERRGESRCSGADSRGT